MDKPTKVDADEFYKFILKVRKSESEKIEFDIANGRLDAGHGHKPIEVAGDIGGGFSSSYCSKGVEGFNAEMLSINNNVRVSNFKKILARRMYESVAREAKEAGLDMSGVLSREEVWATQHNISQEQGRIER